MPRPRMSPRALQPSRNSSCYSAHLRIISFAHIIILAGAQMRILASAAHKGGVGKTTLAAHLAVEAERVGAGPVVLLDTDPQESLTDWHKVRVGNRPTLLSP